MQKFFPRTLIVSRHVADLHTFDVNKIECECPVEFFGEFGHAKCKVNDADVDRRAPVLTHLQNESDPITC